MPTISFLDKKTLKADSDYIFVIVSSFVLFSLVLWLRSWHTISVPSLFVEDASHYFNKYYGGHFGINAVFSRPHGYYNVLNHFVGWITGFCDVRIQPTIYVVFAVLVSFCAVFLISFSGIIKNRLLLFSMPFVLGLTGLNHIFYYTTLTYQMYVLIIVLLGIVILPAPARWTTVALQCVLSVILVFSGPYSVVSVPLCLVLFILFNDRKKRVLWGATIMAVIFYMSTSGSVAKFGNLFQYKIVEKMFHTLINDVCFLGLVHGPFNVLFLIVFFFVLLFFFLLRKDRLFVYLGISLLVLSASSLVPFFLSTKIALYRDPYPCHLLISQFFWIVFVYFSIDRLLIKYDLNYVFKYAIVIFLFALVFYDNSVNTHKANVKTNKNIKLFVQKIHYAESLNLQQDNKYVMISAEGARQRAFMPQVRVGSYRESAINVELDYNNINKD